MRMTGEEVELLGWHRRLSWCATTTSQKIRDCVITGCSWNVNTTRGWYCWSSRDTNTLPHPLLSHHLSVVIVFEGLAGKIDTSPKSRGPADQHEHLASYEYSTLGVAR